MAWKKQVARSECTCPPREACQPHTTTKSQGTQPAVTLPGAWNGPPFPAGGGAPPAVSRPSTTSSCGPGHPSPGAPPDASFQKPLCPVPSTDLPKVTFYMASDWILLPPVVFTGALITVAPALYIGFCLPMHSLFNSYLNLPPNRPIIYLQPYIDRDTDVKLCSICQ